MRIVVGILLALLVFSFDTKFSTIPYKFPELKIFPKMPVSENNPVTVEGVNLGRYLFYDPILSSDSSMSCASCHNQKSAFSDSPNDYSKGRNGTKSKRNTMPLFNLAWYPAYFWDGRAKSIEEQIFHPVRDNNEMNLEWKVAVSRLKNSKFYQLKFKKAFGDANIDSVQIAYSIAQFLRTLISYQSKYDQVINGMALFSKDEYEGFALANDQTKGDCIHCHITDGDVLGTTLVFSNNGLDSVINPAEFKDKGRGTVTGKINDNGKFIVPSLRNLSFTAPYMHDGRFKTLEEVIDFYSEGVKQCANIDSKMEFAHQGGAKLNSDDKKKIIAFLKTLSDSTFVSNIEFENPFKKAKKKMQTADNMR
ncbi:MAG: cytochrome-c peroxidase [Bacteroidetes bacterium]|nr:cytochrome-c peroxidase [Bacteroidota bacterium]